MIFVQWNFYGGTVYNYLKQLLSFWNCACIVFTTMLFSGNIFSGRRSGMISMSSIKKKKKMFLTLNGTLVQWQIWGGIINHNAL